MPNVGDTHSKISRGIRFVSRQRETQEFPSPTTARARTSATTRPLNISRCFFHHTHSFDHHDGHISCYTLPRAIWRTHLAFGFRTTVMNDKSGTRFRGRFFIYSVRHLLMTGRIRIRKTGSRDLVLVFFVMTAHYSADFPPPFSINALRKQA